MTVLSIRGWSIDRESGHCAHSAGLHAYVDASPTPSGALRCIGPFTQPGTPLTEAQVKALAHDLTAGLECLPEHNDRYVLWGAFQARARYQEHVVTIMGERAGIIPNPGLRTELALRPGATLNLEREWVLDAARGFARHRNGLAFHFACEHRTGLAGLLSRALEVRIGAPGGVDPATLHPELEDDLLCVLAARAHVMLNNGTVLRRRLDLVKEDTLLRWQDQQLAEAS